MSTQQGLRQASFRAIGGTAGTYNGDSRAAFEAEATVPAGSTYNEAWLLWLQARLGSSEENLPGLMHAFAVANGAHNWSSLGSFDPNGPGGVIDGLAFWYRADSAADFDDPDAIGQWIDKTPEGTNDAVQGTGTDQPRLAVPIESNGRLAVRFDGLNDYLEVTTPPDISAGVTILTVYHVWTRTDFDGVVSVGDDGAADDEDSYFVFHLNTAASGNMQVFRDDTDPLEMVQPDPEHIAQALFTVVDNAAAPGAGEYRDQVNADVTDAFTDPVPALGAPDNIILGARILAGPTVGSHLEVDLYEVACWVPARDASDLDAIEAYVESRYGLSTAAVPARLLLDTGGAFLINPDTGFLQLG